MNIKVMCLITISMVISGLVILKQHMGDVVAKQKVEFDASSICFYGVTTEEMELLKQTFITFEYVQNNEWQLVFNLAKD